MTWKTVPANTLLHRYSDTWERLQREYCDPNPLLDIRFVQSALKHFDNDSDDIRLAVREESGEPVGMCLVERCGIGQWQLFLPSQVPIGPLLLRSDLEPDAITNYLNELLAALPNYAWSVGLLKQDPAYFPVQSVQHELCCERLHYATTVNIDMRGTFAEYWQGRSRNLRRKMRRLLRKLGQEPYCLVEFRDPSEMDQAIREHGRLESAGWKSAGDTAIHNDNRQGLFYREVMARFAEQGDAVAFQLRVAGRTVASQIAIRQHGVLALLKTAHDESFRHLSPGRLLDYLMLQRLFEAWQLSAVEFYTNASVEDVRWCTGRRDIYHFSYFRSKLFREMTEAARRIRRVGTPDRHRVQRRV